MNDRLEIAIPRDTGNVSALDASTKTLPVFADGTTRPHARDPRLIYAGAHEQARALAGGEVSAEALLEQILARIDRLDPTLNAVVFIDEAGARAAAKAADTALQQGVRLPLLGVPVTVKESFDVEGWPTTVGDVRYQDNLAVQDAPAVAALRAAGAILIGKTNVPLGLADLQSFNEIYGLTRNPWDLSRTPGGSSGGSATALAAGFSSLELGTDIGGSIRIPAHFTGVFGHKPSQGLISLRGTGVPQGRHATRDLVVAGPLARTAADLELALDLLVNQDPVEKKAWRVSLPPARHAKLADFRVLLLAQWPGTDASISEQEVIKRTARNLRAHHVTVFTPETLARAAPDAVLPDLVAAHALYRGLLGASLASPPPLDASAAARLAALADNDASADATWLRSFSISHRDWLLQHEARLALRAQWEKLFNHIDVVLTPVAPLPAFAHNAASEKDARRFPVSYEDGERELYFRELFHWAGLPVVPGLPATSFPVGLDASGLPIGAQVVGAYLEDRTPLAFARLYEAAFGGFIPPSGY
ncbi:amidase [Robbsia andropogonis]|uniref:amidase n=3 Tax=Robbsia andropogonis TaxID=28092 RepID=UPI0009E19D1F|nr:amidase [Robbsia andropogonis]MCP1120016.1 amidase [Robbsia andropogonis]MCP1129925.1 amidase [Robbsia andropogonis]